MRVVGLLLVSALMIVPVVTAQVFARSFSATMWLAMVIGGVVTLGGLLITFAYPAPPGATIVVLAITLFEHDDRRPRRCGIDDRRARNHPVRRDLRSAITHQTK